MEELPTEILSYLCKFLPIPSLKIFRLLCKSFAYIGREALFTDFEFKLYPNSHRLYQLEVLAVNKPIASRLKCLTFESGVQLEYADFKYWAANVYQELSQTWTRNLGVEGCSHEVYEKFHSELQARLTPDLPRIYDLYRWHLDQQAELMAALRVRDRLAGIMNNLKKVNPGYALKLVMAEPQITLDHLEKFPIEEYAADLVKDPDPRRRVANRRRYCLDHFHHFLDAALMSSSNIRQVTAVDLPQQLLSLNQFGDSPVLEAFFRQLQTVDIKLGSFPYSDWLSRGGLPDIYTGGRNVASRRLSSLLNRPEDLQTLRLEFPVGKEVEYSFDLFDRTNIDRLPRLWLTNLKGLDLCYIYSRWGPLRAFLQDAKNLKSLQLSNCRLETGSMIDLIQFLPSMHLESISLLGVWGVDEDEGQWHSHNPDDFSNCYAATSYEGPYAVNGLKYQIEHFALVGGQCPLPAWTVHGNEEQFWEQSGDTSWHYIPADRN